MAIPIQVVFDCADPPVVARFWADALGYQLQGPPEPTAAWQAWLVEHGITEEHWNDASAIIDPDGNGPRIYFQRVPEPKALKSHATPESVLHGFGEELRWCLQVVGAEQNGVLDAHGLAAHRRELRDDVPGGGVVRERGQVRGVRLERGDAAA